MKNEDDHEDEELEMKEEVPNLKTSLENADLKKQNKGGRRSTTRFENLSGECRFEEENHRLEERRTGEEEEAAQALGK